MSSTSPVETLVGDTAAAAVPRADDEGVRERLTRLKAQVDALQVHAAREPVPGWRQIPVIISVLATLFGFFTWWDSTRRTTLDQQRGMQAELRQNIQRLQELQRASVTLPTDYAALPPDALQALAAQLNSEAMVRADAAARLLDALGAQASPTERLVVATALMLSTGDTGRALPLVQAALAQGGALTHEKTNALRTLAQLAFQSGEIGQFRKFMGEAQAAIDAASFTPPTRAFHSFLNALPRASAELTVGRCADARGFLDAAESALRSYPWAFQPFNANQVRALRAQLAQCREGQPLAQPPGTAP